MEGRWAHRNFTIWTGGHTYRNRLTITRPEYPGYVLTGHSAQITLRARGAADPALVIGLNLVETPILATVGGLPYTLVAAFELIIAPSQIASLTAGEAYGYAVVMTDSRGESSPQAKGTIYVGRPV